ncbi:hypothetical protein ACQP2U_43610 (plasmid) [Nocardia sp. CA-084685]|uniref:hypothetical protein n=1 Tax=Nocardia sp. CA-084685 TaxID=3239970 RepID=UPI003D95452F
MNAPLDTTSLFTDTPALTGPVVTYDPARLTAWLDITPDPDARPGATYRTLLGLDNDLRVFELLDRHIVTDMLGWISDDNDDGGRDGLTVTGWEPKPGVTIYLYATYGRRDHRDGADGLIFHAVIPGGPTLVDRLDARHLHDTGAVGETALHLLLTRLAHTLNTCHDRPW